MTTVEVTPGICGYDTVIHCTLDDMYSAELALETDCAQIRQLSDAIDKQEMLQELGKPITENQIYQAAARCKVHTACPVPSAICKALEVEAGLALPADVHFRISQNSREL